MKKLIFLSVVFLFSISLVGQVKINPQLGLTFLTLKDLPAGVEYDGKAGVSVGADFRIGDTFQLIPGIHYISSSSVISDATGTIQEDLKMSSLKLKALLGYNLINSDAFKLRLNAGPSYDFLLSDNVSNLSGDIKKGDFYLQGGVGVDILFITVDLGYAHSLTTKFNNSDAKMHGLYATVGIVF